MSRSLLISLRDRALVVAAFAMILFVILMPHGASPDGADRNAKLFAELSALQ